MISKGPKNMEEDLLTERERKMAEFCRDSCPVCRRARRKQKGLSFWFVTRTEEGICPCCQAHEKVYGKKAHERAE